MFTFKVKFKDLPPLKCIIDNTDLGRKYYELVKQQWHDDQHAIFRDPQRYTFDYFTDLAHQAHRELGWDWIKPKYDLPTTTLLHKDIEQYLSQGYEHIPEEHDELLHEIHFALHAIESGSRRNSWLQIEWYNDRGFSIPCEQYPAKLNLEFGDLRLQNPYVGHHPLYLYQQRDSTNIMQTCKFHDFAKPGINVVINKNSYRPFDWDHYMTWFNKHSPQFLQLHGEQKLRQYTGHPVIGKIENLNDLETVLKTSVLEFESLVF
jgi:hypothetical protein